MTSFAFYWGDLDGDSHILYQVNDSEPLHFSFSSFWGYFRLLSMRKRCGNIWKSLLFRVCQKAGPLETVNFFYLFFKTLTTGLLFVRGVDMSALWSAIRVAFSMFRMSCKPREMLIRREVNPDLAQSTWKCVYACPSGIFLCYVGGQFSWNTTKIMKRRKSRAGTDYMNPTRPDWLRRCWAQVYTLPAGLCLFHERALSLLLKQYFPGKNWWFLSWSPQKLTACS